MATRSRWGSKPVSQRRDDALARVPWQEFETLVARYYREQGYQVEHVGTGKSRRDTDGGVDLKLRREGEYILVQCKRENANQVPYNPVVQLAALVTTEDATGAIFINTGEYTRAAKEKAAKFPSLKLIDGEEARTMLNPLLGSTISRPRSIESTILQESEEDASRAESRQRKRVELSAVIADANKRSVDSSYRKRGQDNSEWVVRLAFGLILLFFLAKCVPSMLRNSIRKPQQQVRVTQPASAPASVPAPVQMAKPTEVRSVDNSMIRGVQPVAPSAVQYHSIPMTDAELREWERKNKKSMEIIKKTTPEM